MSLDNINNKRIERVKESYQSKEMISRSKKEFQLERDFENNSHNEQKNNNSDNFDIVKSLHLILLYCSTLTKKQKFDFCDSQRYFMKLYLKEILRKI